MNNKIGRKQGIELEICCGSLEDVLLSSIGGAHRVELNAALELGGLTPGIGTLKLAREKTEMEIIAMLRPRGGGFCYSDKEFETMLIDIELLLENGADGIAFGILTQEGELDYARCEILVDKMRKFGVEKEAVFHMAFDDAKTDELKMLSMLDKLGFARVLTKGRAATALEGVQALKRYVEYVKDAGLEIKILPGGGVRPHNAEEIVEKTGALELHGKLHGRFGGEADVVDIEALKRYVEWADGFLGQ